MGSPRPIHLLNIYVKKCAESRDKAEAKRLGNLQAHTLHLLVQFQGFANIRNAATI